MSALLGLAVLAAGCALLSGSEDVLVLEDLAAGAGESRLKASTPEPVRRAIRYRTADGREYAADLYRPREPVGAGLVLVPGAVEAGRADPRLIAFSRTLARARFLVLVPDLPLVRAFQLRPENVEGVAAAASHMAEHLRPPRLGLAAVSYSVGPAVLATLDPALRPHVDFLLGIGGYYDLEQVLTYITTGCRSTRGGGWECEEPPPHARWAFVRSNLDRLTSPSDRALLREIATRRLQDPDAAVRDRVERLGPEGTAVYRMVTNGDPERVPVLIERLPAAVRADIRALTLDNKDLQDLQTSLILVHGEEDPMIPPSESVALAAAAPRDRVRLILVDGLGHVDIVPAQVDRSALLEAVQTLLAQRAPARRGAE